MARHYEKLTGPERFSLMVEAMARRDDVEAERLEATCPRFTYRVEDAEFRERMRRAYAIASCVYLDMRAGLAQIRMVQTLKEVHKHFAGPVARLATAAFMCGRSYGQHEVGAADAIASVPEVAVALCEPELQESLAEIEEIAAEATLLVVDTLQYAVGQAYASDLLSQWEGFSRFCEDALATDALTLVRAFKLDDADPAADVRAAYPEATACEADAARWCAQWTQGWDRRFRRRA